MIYFRNKFGDLLHVIYNVFEQIEPRAELCDSERALQLSVIRVWSGQSKTVNPHSHTPVVRTTNESIEAWIVMEGKGIVVLFDDNDKFIDMHFLRFGDVLVTFKGAHSLKTSDILMIECKNGPFVDTKHWIE